VFFNVYKHVRKNINPYFSITKDAYSVTGHYQYQKNYIKVETGTSQRAQGKVNLLILINFLTPERHLLINYFSLSLSPGQIKLLCKKDTIPSTYSAALPWHL